MSIETTLYTVLEDERDRHPGMTVPDLGKLLYQAVFGGDHWVRSPQAFADALRAEWMHGLSAPSDRGPIQVIDPDGRTARLHLAEARAAGLELGVLRAFLLDQSPRNGETAHWRLYVEHAARLAARARIPFPPQEIRSLLEWSGPGHHTPGYGPAAYRLVHDITEKATRDWLAENALDAIEP